jgi:hypothetical protein
VTPAARCHLRRTALAAALLASAGPAAQAQAPAQESPFTHHVELRQENGFYTDDARVQTLRSMLTADLEYRPRPGLRLRVVGRGWYDWRYAVDDDFERTTRGEGRERVEVRDATLRFSWGRTDFALGRQLVTWGRADGVRVLDLINPLDLREFIIEDHADSKIPLWLIDARRYFGDWSLQVVVAPEHGRTRFAPRGTDFYDAFHDTARAEALERRGPRRFDPGAPDVGLQLGGRLGRVDVSLNAYRGYEPTFAVGFEVLPAPTGPLVRPYRLYERVVTLGGGFAAPLGAWLLRGESIVALDRPFSVASAALPAALAAQPAGGGLVERDNLVALLGVDRSWNATLLSAQIYVDRAAGGALPLERRRNSIIGTLLLRHEWHNGTWRVDALNLYDFEDRTLLAEPRLSYQINDVVTASVGADVFWARDRRSFTGQFRRANRLLASLRLQK